MVSEKALGTASKLARIMPNIKGPGQTTRRLIASVAYSQVLYAAPVISEPVSNSRKLRNILEKVHRTCTLRIISAYRTISTTAASVLAGVPPIDIVLNERRQIYEELGNITNLGEKTRIKNDAREMLLCEWQRLWDESDKGRWTHNLIPDIKVWVNRKHGEVNFFLTQVFSGHGNFGSYLYRFRRKQSATCEICTEPEDSVEHTVMKCPLWNNQRSILPCITGNITIKQLTAAMLENAGDWTACSHFIEEIMRKKAKHQEGQNRTPNLNVQLYTSRMGD